MYQIYKSKDDAYIDEYTIIFIDSNGNIDSTYVTASDNPSAFYQHGYAGDIGNFKEFLNNEQLVDVSTVSKELQMAILRELQYKE